MNNKTGGLEKAIILWLSGLRLADISTLPEVTKLKEHAVLVELDASPITGSLNQHYQILTGKEPSSFGFFDTLVPRDYHVIEESTGRGGVPKWLPDLLGSGGWTVRYEETQPAELAGCIERLTQSASSLSS